MSFDDISVIAVKDLSVTMRRRSIVTALLAFPLLVGVGLPLVLVFAGGKTGGLPADALRPLLTSFQFFFVTGAATLPTAMAAYSFVGEKTERSLEPLLATPVSDVDVLVGKALAAVLPAVVSMWVGMTVFMAITDVQAHRTLGLWFFPNPTALLAMFLLVPAVALVGAEVTVLISARATDVRSAQQLGTLVVIPFAALYVASEIGALSLNAGTMLALAAALVAVAVVLFFSAPRRLQPRGDPHPVEVSDLRTAPTKGHSPPAVVPSQTEGTAGAVARPRSPRVSSWAASSPRRADLNAATTRSHRTQWTSTPSTTDRATSTARRPHRDP